MWLKESEPFMASSKASNVRQLPRATWLVLLFVMALLCVSVGQVIYRLWLPTEGWSYSQGLNGDDYEANARIIFISNLVGSPSPIQASDHLLAIEGQSIDKIQALGGPAISDSWQAGQTVHYTVRREGQTVELAVPLKHWTLASISAYSFRDVNTISGFLSSLLLFGIGLFVMLKRPREWVARALCLFGAAFLTNWISSSIVPDGSTTQFSAVFPIPKMAIGM